jgi:hypothetical protein
MTTSPAAPSEADAPHPWVRAILHARIPAALKLLLLALLSALAKAEAPRHLLRLPRQDWFISAHTNPNEDPESDLDWSELRRRRRARAELGWLLRGRPNRGMPLSGHRAPALRPAPAARAPPMARSRPHSARIRRENPACCGDDSRPQRGQAAAQRQWPRPCPCPCPCPRQCRLPWENRGP